MRKVRLVKALPGIGKTTALLRELPKRHPRARILYVGPTKILVKQAITTFEGGTDLKAARIFGLDEHDCPSKEEILDLMKRRLPYKKAHCDPCPLFASCTFHADRREARESQYVFTTMSYITKNPRFWRQHQFDVVILDENVYRQVRDKFSIEKDDVRRFRRSYEHASDDLKSQLDVLAMRLDRAFKQRRDLSAEKLWDSVELDEDEVRAYTRSLSKSRRNAINFLPDLIRAKRQHRTFLYRDGKLLAFLRARLPSTPFYYVLDATADAEVVARTLRANVEEIDVEGDIPSQALFVQCTTNSFSKHALGSEKIAAQLERHVIAFIEDCRAHGRRPALGVRPSMVRSKPDKKNDDFLLIDRLRSRYSLQIVTKDLNPAAVQKDDVLVVTYGTERGINVIEQLGVTDIMVIGALSPNSDDVIDMVRFLYPKSRTSDEKLEQFSTHRLREVRTRQGVDWNWAGSGYTHPYSERVFRQLAVAPIVQLAERVRSILPAQDHRLKKRIFLLTTEDVSEWVKLDWIGTAEEMHKRWFSGLAIAA